MGKRGPFWVCLALAVGFGLRWFFVHVHPHVEGDSLVYGDLATNMLRHHRFGFTDAGAAGGVRSTLIRLPGYPVLMAASFALFGVGSYASVMYGQLLLDLATCGLLAALAGRLMGRRAGFCALWLAVLCPFTANYVAAPLTEIPAAFCVALCFFSLERWGDAEDSGMEHAGISRYLWAAVLGGALSFAVLLRPDRALLAVAAVGAMAYVAFRARRPVGIAWWRGAWARTALVCLLIAAPLAMWGVRNWRVFHVVQPLAPRNANDPGETINVGFQRWYRTWAIDFKSTIDVYWSYDGSALSLDDLPARAFDTAAQRAQTAALYAAYNEVVTPAPAFDAAFASLAADRVRASPLRYYVELPLLRLADMWLRPRTEMLPVALDWWRFRAHPKASVESVGYALLNFAYLLLAVVGLRRWTREGWSGRRPLGYAMVAFVLLRSALLMTIDNSEPRYTIDCFPVIILLAAFAFGRRRASAAGSQEPI